MQVGRKSSVCFAFNGIKRVGRIPFELPARRPSVVASDIEIEVAVRIPVEGHTYCTLSTPITGSIMYRPSPVIWMD